MVYLFLQSWRATLIPLLAVPVSLVGTFVLFPLLGFSINTLSLFGLVLAIGLVVDDAIVVVEAVERHIHEGVRAKGSNISGRCKRSPGPVIGVALVLAAVFVPTAFVPGITGRLYQQFAVTIAVSVIISAFNALTLSPALCALSAAPADGERKGCWESSSPGSIVFLVEPPRDMSAFRECLFDAADSRSILLLFFALAAVFFGRNIPASFLPDEDQGFFYINLQLPNAASLQRTDAVCRKIEAILSQTARGAVHHECRRLQLVERRAKQLWRFLFRHPESLGRAQKADRTISSAEGQIEPRFDPVP